MVWLAVSGQRETTGEGLYASEHRTPSFHDKTRHYRWAGRKR
jgi:hypothetical protein